MGISRQQDEAETKMASDESAENLEKIATFGEDIDRKLLPTHCKSARKYYQLVFVDDH